MGKILGTIIATALIAVAIIGCDTKNSNNENNNDLTGTLTNEPTQYVDDTGKLQKVYQEVKAEYNKTYIPNMLVEGEQLAEAYGINFENIDDYIIEVPTVGMSIDTFMGFRAKEGKADIVEAEVTSYQNRLKADTLQSPSNKARIEASQVIRVRDHIFFILLGENPDDNATEEEALKFAKKQIKRGADKIISTMG